MALLNDRKAARLAGHRFYQGKPCPHGHAGERYVSKGQCHECQIAGSKARPTGAGRDLRTAWKASNADKVRADKRQYRARLCGAVVSGNVTAAFLSALLEAQGGQCAYCGTLDNISLDHKHPLSRGGGHVPDNLQWLCVLCNSRKGAMTDAEYRDRELIVWPTPWDAVL